MSLTDKQKNLIVEIDTKAKKLLNSDGNEEALLVEVLPLMADIKMMINSVPHKELEMYFYQYDGFYRYMKLLENMAKGIVNGKIQVPD
jgi:hypothetical protein